MKWIRSNTVQNMFALWLAYLLFLVVMYMGDPGDPWKQMFHRPVFLIFAPLLVACIPWVGTKPAEIDDSDDEGRGYDRRRKGFVIPDKARRAVMVWLVALVVFASPHGVWRASFDPLVHQPTFLIFAPMLFACMSLLLPGVVSLRSEVAETAPPISRYQAWKGVVASVIVGGLVVLALVGLNDSTVMNDHGSKLPPNIALLVILALAVVALWRSVKRLRTPG